MEEDPFASFGQFGDRLLRGVDEGDRSAQKFKYLVGVIDQTLITTHKMVISRLAALRQAKGIDDAKVQLETLRLEPLTEAFRVEGLCDLLEGLGTSLLTRAAQARSEGSFLPAELEQVESLGRVLVDREYEVTRAYQLTLRDITSRTVDEESLPEIKRKAEEVEVMLTSQVSDFAAKAERFTRLSST